MGREAGGKWRAGAGLGQTGGPIATSASASARTRTHRVEAPERVWQPAVLWRALDLPTDSAELDGDAAVLAGAAAAQGGRAAPERP